MTHPFALSIDDLACLESIDETASIEGGAAIGLKYTGPGCILTAGYDYENGGHPGVTFKTHEAGGPPFVSTNRYPEDGGPGLPYAVA
jgi:hypothetical protein